MSLFWFIVFFFKKSIYRKSIKVFLNLSKLPVFTSQIPDLQFWLLHLLAFSRFVYFTFITYYFLNCKMYPTYAEIKSTLKLVEVSVFLLFGINLAKWTQRSWKEISDKYISTMYSLCLGLGKVPSHHCSGTCQLLHKVKCKVQS